MSTKTTQRLAEEGKEERGKSTKRERKERTVKVKYKGEKVPKTPRSTVPS